MTASPVPGQVGIRARSRASNPPRTPLPGCRFGPVSVDWCVGGGNVPASGLVERQLFDNLEIDWQRLSGPEIAREPAKNAVKSDGAGEGELPEPTLRNIRLEDLKDTKRLLVLYDQAVKTGLIKGSEHMRREFISLAEHALTEGTVNPCGLFVHLVWNGRFDAITLGDEDTSTVRLKQLEDNRFMKFSLYLI